MAGAMAGIRKTMKKAAVRQAGVIKKAAVKQAGKTAKSAKATMRAVALKVADKVSGRDKRRKRIKIGAAMVGVAAATAAGMAVAHNRTATRKAR